MAEITLATANVGLVHDVKANMAKFEAMIRDAAARSAALIAFPETALQGYLFGIGHAISKEEWEYHYAVAEGINGPSIQALTGLAAELNIIIVMGMTEKVSGVGSEVLYDSAVTIGPAGVMSVYRKVHLGAGEKLVYAFGQDWPVARSPIGKLGTMICYDLKFPESARQLVLGGAQILVFPTIWPAANRSGYDEGNLAWALDTLCRARALENQVFLVCSNATGSDDVSDMRFAGQSQIVDPNGRVLARAEQEETVVYATADVEDGIRKARTVGFNGLFFIKDRHPETYDRITAAQPWQGSP
jgi:predicted amidohydrolase